MIKEDCNQPQGARHFAAAVFFWAATALAQAGTGPAPQPFDRVVAAVDTQVITRSQLEFEARVLLVSAGGVAAAFSPLDDEVLGKSLAAIVDQRLVTLEADKLDAYPLEPGELERAVTAFRGRFASEARFRAFLESHDAEVSDLSQVLRRSLRAQRVLDGKLRLRAQASELEARQHLSQHPELKGVTLELVRQRLSAQRFQTLVKEELAHVRRQVDVRFLGPFAPVVRRSE